MLMSFGHGHMNKSGSFSARSAYRMLVATKLRREAWLEGRAGNSNSKGEEKLWTKMWKVDVPSKIKIFLWKLAQQYLPTLGLLHHQKMASQPACALFGSHDYWHQSLIECNMARYI